MSITSSEKYYGAVVLRLIQELSDKVNDGNFSISKGLSKSSFILTGNRPKTLGKGKFIKAGLFIKISNKRLSPWRYNFIKAHQDEIQSLKEQYGQVFVAFVCGDDGIASIDFEQLKEILDDNHEEQEWVSISREIKQNYRVKGNDGNFEKALPRNSFPGNVVSYFKHNLK